MTEEKRAVVIGGGPAGLAAAEALLDRGVAADVYERMPSFGRKFLMAGKSGLNITHSEDEDAFLGRYRDGGGRLPAIVRESGGAAAVTGWMEGLGQTVHEGPGGRVFPAAWKASPLLRAWLGRLRERGVGLHTRHEWRGWTSEGDLLFGTEAGQKTVRADAAVFALGGGSWRRLGSDGAWTAAFSARGVELAPFAPSNAGVLVPWSAPMKARFAGEAVKAVRTSVEAPSGPVSSRAEWVVTETGAESGAIYALSAALREAMAGQEGAALVVDLLPDLPLGAVEKRLSRHRGKQSLSNHLRKTLRLTGVKAGLLREGADKETLNDPLRCAARIKALRLPVTGFAPLDGAISTAGGLSFEALTPDLMVEAMPGVFCAGEMLDWDAPTGGYLLTACLATGRRAGLGAADFLASSAG